MIKKIITFSICILLLIGVSVRVYYSTFTGQNVETIVRTKEVKEFTKEMVNSNKKIKKLNFYYFTGYFCADLIYDDDLNKEDMNLLTDQFKSFINVENMKKIQKKYWDNSEIPRVEIYIYVDDIRNKRDYDYIMRNDHELAATIEKPEDADVYSKWTVWDKAGNKVLIKDTGNIDINNSNN